MKKKKINMKVIIGRIISFGNTIAAAMIVFLCIWILADVSGRFFFSKPLAGTPELTANLIVAILFLQVSKVELDRAHVRSELILNKLKTKGKVIMEIVSSFFGIALFTFATIASWKPVRTAWELLEYDGEGSMHVPTYPFKTIVLIGCILMIIQLLFNFISDIQEYHRLKEAKD